MAEAGDMTQSQMRFNHAVAEGDAGLPPPGLLGGVSRLHSLDQSYLDRHPALCVGSWNPNRSYCTTSWYQNIDIERNALLTEPARERDNVRPVPLWERDFCRYAYGISWETFCENKRFNALYKNVLDWDDSGAFENFEEAKERFRVQYNGELYEDPVLDPDMHIDEVDHLCVVDPELIVDLDEIAARVDMVTELSSESMDNLIPENWGEPVPNLVPTGWGDESDTPTPDAAWGGQGNKKPEAIWGAQPYCTPKNMNSNFYGVGSSSNGHQQEVIGGGKIWISSGMKWSSSGGSGNVSNWNSGGGSRGGGSNGRNWNGGGGRGGSNWNGGDCSRGGGRKWNCFGGGSGSGWNGNGGGGGKQRNQGEGKHLQRSGGGQHLQGQGRRKMEWRPVQHNKAPNVDPAA